MNVISYDKWKSLSEEDKMEFMRTPEGLGVVDENGSVVFSILGKSPPPPPLEPGEVECPVCGERFKPNE